MADLNPVRGSEQAGFRPVAVISGNLLNQNLNIVFVVPLTSQIKQYYGNPILEPSAANGLKVKSEMLIFHARSVSKTRLVEKIGNISKQELSQALATLQDIMTL